MSNLVAVDTNILVYASDQKFVKYPEASSLVEKVLAGEIEGALALQNLMEFMATVTNSKKMDRPMTIGQAYVEARRLITGGFRLVCPNAMTMRVLNKVVKDKSNVHGQGIHDLFLAATLLTNGVRTIVTENTKDFEGIKDLKAISLEEVGGS